MVVLNAEESERFIKELKAEEKRLKDPKYRKKKQDFLDSCDKLFNEVENNRKANEAAQLIYNQIRWGEEKQDVLEFIKKNWKVYDSVKPVGPSDMC